MTKTNFIIWLSVFVVILLFFNFSKLIDKPQPTIDYNIMTAGQLLDVKIGLDEEAEVLNLKITEVVKIYETKRAKKKGTTPIEQVNKELGLE